MPSLPIPLGTNLAGSDLPVVSQADVNAVLPLFLRPDDPAPVRDAIFSALTQILLEYQTRAAQAAGQSDVLDATGTDLDQAASELGVFRQAGESDTLYRARAIAVPLIVTPTAILAAANALLAPFTAIKARYYEALTDRFIVRSTLSPASPRSYIYKVGSLRASPDYFERLYESEASVNGGFAITGREPGGSHVFSDTIGRYFVLRVPDLSSLDAEIAAAYAGGNANAGFFVGNGTDQSNTDYVRKNATSAVVLYDSIINAVNRIKGASIRWALDVDPQLVT